MWNISIKQDIFKPSSQVIILFLQPTEDFGFVLFGIKGFTITDCGLNVIGEKANLSIIPTNMMKVRGNTINRHGLNSVACINNNQIKTSFKAKYKNTKQIYNDVSLTFGDNLYLNIT